jgi:hypothetical protein
MKKPKYWSLAKKTLSKKDKVIKKIIATHRGSLVCVHDYFRKTKSKRKYHYRYFGL